MGSKRPTDGIVLMPKPATHDPSTIHSFGHTDGKCPKCGCEQQIMLFCLPYQRALPALPGCGLEGEHLHRVCGACQYPWVERCLDQYWLSQEKGEVPVESELAAILASVVDVYNNVQVNVLTLPKYRGMILNFHRDADRDTVLVTLSPAPTQQGEIVHPKVQMPQGPTGRGAA
jgi:hypothetical protein